MKQTDFKSASKLIYLLGILYLLFPLGTFVSHFFGRQFSMFHNGIYAMATMLFTIGTAIALFRKQMQDVPLPADALAAFLPLLSMANAIAAYAQTSTDGNQSLILLCSFPNFLCTAILGIWIHAPKPAKLIGGILSGITFLPMSLILMVLLLFGTLDNPSVIQKLPSPKGSYIAAVIDDDEGALGGSTLVDVYDARPLNLLLVRIQKAPKRVYRGEWGEFQDMEIQWEDERTLSINGRKIPVA